jgi:hypothetical protein
VEIASGPQAETSLVSEELRAPTALESILARPSVYVRGPVEGFQPAAIAETASSSTRDPFLMCLLDPPASRTESSVMGKVRATFAGDAGLLQRTAQARRLHDIVFGARQIALPWSDRVRAAEDTTELGRIGKEFANVGVEAAKRAASAQLLVVAVDEPDEPGPTEFDGERPHQVRVGLVDVERGKILLRLRKHVDPTWLSQGARLSYARAADSCALALDVRALN